MDANRTQVLGGSPTALDPNRTQMSGAPTLDPNKTIMGKAPTINATVTIKPIQCPVCKTFNPVGVMFCVDCGLIFDRALDGDAFGAPTILLPMLVEQSGKENPLRPGTTVIGREADIMLVDTRVSRRHAQITNLNDQLTIEDLGSTNGTKVNDRKLQPGEKVGLTGTEKISFGGLECALSLPGAAGSQKTQTFGGNKTAAITVAPQKEVAPAKLVGGDKEFPLRLGQTSFGRKAENDICIPEPYVSGRHGLIEVTEDGLFITDIGSSNGTLLNDLKLSPNMRTAITSDDVIKLGTLEFKVVRA